MEGGFFVLGWSVWGEIPAFAGMTVPGSIQLCFTPAKAGVPIFGHVRWEMLRT
tara:strand:- start:7683 stop:7841 length:159 start_codon:yes stop_codon:yes gene_type:complete